VFRCYCGESFFSIEAARVHKNSYIRQKSKILTNIKLTASEKIAAVTTLRGDHPETTKEEPAVWTQLWGEFVKEKEQLGRASHNMLGPKAGE
jgi:lipase chaperone LimK